MLISSFLSSFLFITGDSLGVVVVSAHAVRPEQRAMPSTAFLMPSTLFWDDTEPLVITDKRNYTVNDFEALFTDLGYMDGYYLWQDTHGLIQSEYQRPFPLLFSQFIAQLQGIHDLDFHFFLIVSYLLVYKILKTLTNT